MWWHWGDTMIHTSDYIQVLLLLKRSSQVFVWGLTKVKLLRRMLRSRGIRTGLHGVEVNSVDGFQGREKEARIEGFRVKFSIIRLMQLRNKWHEQIHGMTFWGVRWWNDGRHIYVWQNYWLRALYQPFGFRSLWSVQCDQIWRMPPASFETGDASMLPWPVQSRFPNKSAKGVQHEHLDLFNKNSSQSWDGEKLVNTKCCLFSKIPTALVACQLALVHGFSTTNWSTACHFSKVRAAGGVQSSNIGSGFRILVSWRSPTMAWRLTLRFQGTHKTFSKLVNFSQICTTVQRVFLVQREFLGFFAHEATQRLVQPNPPVLCIFERGFHGFTGPDGVVFGVGPSWFHGATNA